MDVLKIDPSDFAKYAAIEDIVNGAYKNRKVRVIGTILRSDKQSKKIVLSHQGSQIECTIPEEYLNIMTEEHQVYQVIGVVKPVSPLPVIECSIVRALSCVDESAYDFAVSKFNEFVFQ